MVQDEASSSVTSSPLQHFSLMSLSPSTIGSPYSPWIRELKSDERGLYLIHLLLNCANHVASNSLDHANAFLDQISLLSSPEGDTMQRIASYFTEALAHRILRAWRGLYRSLTATAHIPQPIAELAQARRHFLDLCPILKLSFIISNQVIVEAMEGEKMIHVIDFNGTDPAQWVALLQALSTRPEGPPHLRITSVNEHKEMLNHMAVILSEEAEKLDIPFQFNPIICRIDCLDIESLRVKTGEALAISSISKLHSLLACEEKSKPSPIGKQSNISQLHRMVQMGQGTLGELMEKDHANGYVPSPDSSSSSPIALCPCVKLESFLNSLWSLSPKIMVVTEQESNHNGGTLNERFIEALNFYATLFDCLESTVARNSVERLRVEKMLFGEEIKNIISCEGLERKVRHEKLERWVQRFDATGFGRVPLSYFALLQARRMIQGFGCEAYKVKEENGCCFICWQDRPLYSVSAWRCRRYD